MRGVNIEKYRFDFDLTFGVLALNPDGTVYHRYGGRDSRSPGHWTTPASFEQMLSASLERHQEYTAAPSPPELQPRLQPEQIPAFAKRDKGECIHCHNVHEGLQQEAKDQKTWSFADIWVHPAPERLGLDLDRDDQRLVIQVQPESAADKAGLKVGDRLIRVGTTTIASASDVMHASDSFPAAGGKLPVAFLRNGEAQTVKLSLPPDWKRSAPASFAWRAIKWTLDPVPGFGGPAIDATQRAALKIPEGEFAFRIQYFVTWGPRAAYGKRAGEAGLRADDIVLAVAGKRDFESVDHFHAWWRLTRQAGEVVPIHVLRNGEPMVFQLEVPRS